MNRKILFIGGCGHGKETTNGVAAKNHFLLRRLRDYCQTVKVVDTDGWKKNPMILLRLAALLTIHPKYRIVISLNTPSAYKFVRVANALFPRRHLCYFVIGGVLADYMKEGKVSLTPFKCVDWFMVESEQMKNDMEEMGVRNVIHVPNFKEISYIPAKPSTLQGGTTHFVFLSRIIPEKGCDLIFEAAKRLNGKGLKDKISIHFYGTVADCYKEKFEQQITSAPNCEYKGFLDLKKVENYDVLAQYDLMLFPTFWHGEGFPGIIIDAFIAGLPVIASDWGHNPEIIDHGQTGILIPAKNTEALAKEMEQLADDHHERERMSKRCQQAATRYDSRNVLSDPLLEQIL